MYSRVVIDAEKGLTLLEEAENEQSNQVKECKYQNFILLGIIDRFIREYLGKYIFKICKTTQNHIMNISGWSYLIFHSKIFYDQELYVKL